ncbi:MAG TPA: ATP-binding protein, partial [Rhodocyclaceae bacterium]|nr:ATP-binding protein [Rhodocyclaceae bacterium]
EQDLEELDGLIDASLTYARFEREAPEPHFSPTPLAPWLEDEVANMRPLARGLNIEVDCPPASDRLIDLDRKAMPYALKNLLRNAIKYARQTIRVSVDLQATHLLIHIDDDGIGIPEADRDRIFSAFTRLDRSRDRATGGYGLGLAIVRRVLEMHGGTATADISPLGGARFTLRWPISQH